MNKADSFCAGALVASLAAFGVYQLSESQRWKRKAKRHCIYQRRRVLF